MLRKKEEREEFIARLDGRSSANYRDSMNAAFSGAYAFLGVMMVAFGSTLTSKNKSPQDQNMMILSFCSCAILLVAMEMAQLRLNKKFFKASIMADEVKYVLSQMSPQQIESAIKRIGDDEISLIKAPRIDGIVEKYKFELKYTLAGFFTALAPIPEDKKYLLFTVARAVAGFAIDISRKRGFAKQVDPVDFGAKNRDDEIMVKKAVNIGLNGQEQVLFDSERSRELGRNSIETFQLDMYEDNRFSQYQQLVSNIASELTDNQWKLLRGLTNEQRDRIKEESSKTKMTRLFSDKFFDDFSEDEKKELSEVLSKNMQKFSDQYSDPKRILSEILTFLSFSMTLHYAPVSSRHEGYSPISSAAIYGADFGISSGVFNATKIAKNNILQKWRDREREGRVHPFEENNAESAGAHNLADNENGLADLSNRDESGDNKFSPNSSIKISDLGSVKKVPNSAQER